MAVVEREMTEVRRQSTLACDGPGCDRDIGTGIGPLQRWWGYLPAGWLILAPHDAGACVDHPNTRVFCSAECLFNYAWRLLEEELTGETKAE